MQIYVAEHAGFCYGVNHAVSKVKELISENKALPKFEQKLIQTLGPIIHNETLVNSLIEDGVKIIDSPEQAQPNSIVVIRAHGVGKAVIKKLNELNVTVVDGTCKYVKKIHDLVDSKSKDGYGIVIVGDRKHQEVIGIHGWSNGKAIVVDCVEDLEKNEIKELYNSSKGLCFVAQTTITCEKWEKIIQISKKIFENMIKFDTICGATKKRQNEAAGLSSEVDAMFVIGSKTSSNTLSLFKVCKEHCDETFLVETKNDISPLNINNYKKIGVSAGASAPDEIIKEVIRTMSEINEKGQSFEEMLEDYGNPAQPGRIVKGTVIRTTNEGVFVDIGAKSEGLIPIEEFTNDPNFVINESIKVGDEIEAKIFRVSDKEGTITLSKRDLDRVKNFKLFQTVMDNNEVVDAVVVRSVKGGVIANSNGTDIFVPAALLSDRFIKDTSSFTGKEIKLKIISIDEAKRSIRGSAKELLVEAKKAAEAALWEKIVVGETLEGVVKNFTDFRAFVDLGGIDGSIHKSELSWNRIKHPSDVLSVGDKVEVKVLSADPETRKISLGFKKAEDNPWFNAEEKYGLGNVISGKVVRIVAFGAFIELEKGIDALCHISQISDYRLAKVEDALEIGQEVSAKVIEFDPDKKRISVSIREVAAINPEKVVAEAEAKAAEEADKQAEKAKIEEDKAAEKAAKAAERAAAKAEKQAMSAGHVEEMSNTIGDISALKDLLSEDEPTAE